MWFGIRKALRRRRDARRRRSDAVHVSMLASEDGRSRYWSDLDAKCAESSMIELLEHTLMHEGDVIECGVFRGGTLRMICKTVRDLVGREKTVFGLDTFSGFPDGSISIIDASLFRPVSRLKDKFKDAGDVPDLLRHFAKSFDIHLDIRQGRFEDTLPTVTDRRYCFVHLDCDTYRSHMQCLIALYDKVVRGGVIVFDDYGSNEWPGAIDDFFLGKPERILVSNLRNQEAWYVTKMS